MNNTQEKVIGNYEIERFLGQGTTGKVMLAHHKETKQKVAIKIIPKIAFTAQQNLQSTIQRKLALIRLTKHSNIIELIDVLESENNLYVVFEYAENGELFDYLVANRFLSADVALDFFRQIVYAIEYLHMHGICHRDLKPENILLDNSMRIKIADFGFAHWVNSELLTDACGSSHYAAPEVISAQPYDGKAADIWSIGIILFALVAGYLPFDDQSPSRLKAKILKGTFSMPEFNPKIKDLLKKMITVDPKKRITIAEIKEHPCFRWGMSDDVILPSPFSIEVSEILKISPEVMHILDKLCSLNHEQFVAELASESHNLPRAIVSMLSSHLDMEQLPWSNATSSIKSDNQPVAPHQNKQLQDKSIMRSLSNVSLQNDSSTHNLDTLQNTSDDPFHRHPNASFDVVTANSVVTRPNWNFNEVDEDTISKEIDMKAERKKLWELIREIQQEMKNYDVSWLYPDPIRLYVMENNKAFYAEIEVKIFDKEKFKLRFILRKGDANRFTIFAASIISSLEGKTG